MKETLTIVFIRPPRIRPPLTQRPTQIRNRQHRSPIGSRSCSIRKQRIDEFLIWFSLVRFQSKVTARKRCIVFDCVGGMHREVGEIERVFPVGPFEKISGEFRDEEAEG